MVELAAVDDSYKNRVKGFCLYALEHGYRRVLETGTFFTAKSLIRDMLKNDEMAAQLYGGWSEGSMVFHLSANLKGDDEKKLWRAIRGKEPFCREFFDDVLIEKGHMAMEKRMDVIAVRIAEEALNYGASVAEAFNAIRVNKRCSKVDTKMVVRDALLRLRGGYVLDDEEVKKICDFVAAYRDSGGTVDLILEVIDETTPYSSVNVVRGLVKDAFGEADINDSL